MSKTPDWAGEDTSSNPGSAFNYLHNLNQVKKLYSSIQIYKIRMLDFLVIIDIGLYARMSFFKLNNSLKFHPAYKPGNSIILYSKYIVTLFREEREGKKTNSVVNDTTRTLS